MPEPCGPVSRACQAPASSRTTARRKCVSRPPVRTRSSVTTRIARRNTAVWPCIFRMAGRTNNSKHTIVLTGLPGSPIHGTPPTVPNARGEPGRIRTFQKTRARPERVERRVDEVVLADAHAGGGHDQVARWRTRARSGPARPSSVSFAMPRWTGSAPARRTSASRV